MCDLLLQRGIKRLSAFSVFFSINIFNQKIYLKTTIEWKIKAMVSTKFLCKCIRFVFWFCRACTLQIFANIDFVFCSWHITILFPVLHINMWIYVQIVSSAIQSNICQSYYRSDTLLHRPGISVLHWLN